MQNGNWGEPMAIEMTKERRAELRALCDLSERSDTSLIAQKEASMRLARAVRTILDAQVDVDRDVAETKGGE